MINGRWNHNLHHHHLVLDAVPHGGRVLEIGCGEGLLARDMAAQSCQVTGLDRDEASIIRAHSLNAARNVNFLCGDLMHAPFEAESFDAVISIATLHHVGTAAGLEAMRDLVRPGGTLVIIGLASSVFPNDLLWDVSGFVTTRLFRLTRGYWEHSAPIRHDVPDGHSKVQAIAERILPGARYRRLVLWRFLLIWQKPVP